MKTFYDSKKDTGQDAGGSTPPSPPTKEYPDGWYYTEDEWSRQGMWGPLPEERKRPPKFLSEYGEENTGSTDREYLQEKVDTKI